MALYVQVVNNEVKQCIDTVPAEGVGNAGWKNAVEVRPAITANRQGYTAHTFDLTKDPVEIVYGTFDIPVADRQAGMIANANFAVSQLLQDMSRDPSTFNADTIHTAQAAAATKIAAIEAATTHDQLDAIQ
jgi:hypothetical protein